MGKTLIIQGADFSAVAIGTGQQQVINFSTATQYDGTVALYNGSVKVTAPSGSLIRLYKIPCSGYTRLYIQAAESQRILFTNAALPVTYNDLVTSYLPSTQAASYYEALDATSEVIVTIPQGTAYVYIRKCTSSGADRTPSSAILTQE